MKKFIPVCVLGGMPREGLFNAIYRETATQTENIVLNRNRVDVIRLCLSLITKRPGT